MTLAWLTCEVTKRCNAHTHNLTLSNPVTCIHITITSTSFSVKGQSLTPGGNVDYSHFVGGWSRSRVCVRVGVGVTIGDACL